MTTGIFPWVCDRNIFALFFARVRDIRQNMDIRSSLLGPCGLLEFSGAVKVKFQEA